MALIMTRSSFRLISSAIWSNCWSKAPAGHQLLAAKPATLMRMSEKRDLFNGPSSRDTFLRRAYDKSRVYLSNQFVVGEYRMENYASLIILVFTAIGFAFICYMEILLDAFNGEGNDINRVPVKRSTSDEEKS